MPAARVHEQPYFERVAERIVREGVSFRAACSDEGVNMTSAEADRIYKSKAFQTVLRTVRHRYAQELGKDPDLTKDAAAGMLMHAITKMLEANDYDKAVVAIEKLAKLKGWMGSEGNVNIFGGVTDADLAKAAAEIQKKIDKQGAGSTAKSLDIAAGTPAGSC